MYHKYVHVCTHVLSGFGDLMGEFYFGNEIIHKITNTQPHILRVEIADAYGDVGFAEFSNFT